jgi:hypothetical protein
LKQLTLTISFPPRGRNVCPETPLANQNLYMYGLLISTMPLRLVSGGDSWAGLVYVNVSSHSRHHNITPLYPLAPKDAYLLPYLANNPHHVLLDYPPLLHVCAMSTDHYAFGCAVKNYVELPRSQLTSSEHCHRTVVPSGSCIIG